MGGHPGSIALAIEDGERNHDVRMGARTRALLGWNPEQPGLIADIDHPAYFAP